MMTQTKTALRGATRARRGASVTELAVVMPIFLIMLLGTIDFAQIMYAYGTVSEAARVGARYAIVHGSMASAPVGPAANNSTIDTVVKNNALALKASRLTVTSSWGAGTNAATNPVTVTATYNCPLSVGNLVGLGPINVTGSTTMLISY